MLPPAASSLLVPKRLGEEAALPNTGPAKALGGPGYTIGILVARCVAMSHRSPRLTHRSIFRTGARYSELQGVA